jgi:hypothetical protein
VPALAPQALVGSGGGGAAGGVPGGMAAGGAPVGPDSAVGSVPNPFAIPGLAGLARSSPGLASPAIAATMIVAAGRWCGAPAAAAILTGHLALTQVQRAISEGVPVDGYVQCSAQDNLDGSGRQHGRTRWCSRRGPKREAPALISLPGP